MNTKKAVILSLVIITTLKVFGQTQPNINPLTTHEYTPPAPTQTTTATPNTPYTNHDPVSTAPYTSPPLPQQTAPPPPNNNPPPLTPPPSPLTAPTITEPAQQPIPPPPPKVSYY